MFLQRKRAGEVKARGCADGRKQRTIIYKRGGQFPNCGN